MNNSAQKLGIGVVGAGMASAPHAKSLQDLAEVAEVRGVFRRDATGRQAFAEKHGFPDAASLDALVADPGLDAALILTPPNARKEMVEAFASAGKHILMEKPVERTTAAARELVEICENAGVKLGIVFQHRFRAGSIRLRQFIDEGTFGALRAAQLSVPWWRPQSYYDEPGRGTYARDGGGVLISQAIHAMDLMLSLTGEVEEVQAVAGNSQIHTLEAEDFVGAGLRFRNGAIGSLSATTTSNPGHAEYIALDFDKASTWLQSGELKVTWHDGREESYGDPMTTGAGADPMAFPHDWHRGVIEDFLAAIREDRQPVISGREALKVHCLIDALVDSSRERRAVTVATA